MTGQILTVPIQLPLPVKEEQESAIQAARRITFHLIGAFCQVIKVDLPPAHGEHTQSDLIDAERELVRLPLRQIQHLDLHVAAHKIGTVYSSLLPSRYKTELGIFYTPPSLVRRLIDQLDQEGIDWSATRILDPACGGAAFL